MKKCIDCGSLEVVERKRCKPCVLVFNRQRVKKYHKKDKPRYGIVNCIVCGEKLIQNKYGQEYHGVCKPRYKTIDNYNNVKRSNKANTIARQMILDLGFNLNRKIHVHHIDENPNNNILSNFMLLNQSLHGKLHQFLLTQWSLYWKQYGSNLENCWNILRGQLTTTWLETTGVNVIKIIDIGQSAAEPLNENFIYIFSNEEGSETMHQVPETDICCG